MDSKGYNYFLDLIEERRRAQVKDLFNSDGVGLDGLIEDAKDKAFLAGMQTAGTLLESYLQMFEDEKKEILSELEGYED